MIQENEREEMVKRYESTLMEVDGSEKLLDYLRKSDFYTAPASTKYHGCYKGGLLEHSLQVYDRLAAKMTDPVWQQKLAGTPKRSLIVAALTHDICKVNFYIQEPRNKKTYDPDKIYASGQRPKRDDLGEFVWITEMGYTVKDNLPYGHGEKSVLMLTYLITLSMEEIFAIRWHMGPYSGDKDWNTLAEAFKKYPLILALFEADMESTYMLSEV
jgi:hypothetical protein